ncbi:hypothetical protein BJ138DRAFT_576519 [Hygrophoropsis aurantiaca]|uniref:Uncharacterized protein n=1 Tax=Hygrophoropsis aurantiaca TaxID=72124 RepID=A0ACB8A0K4_9AGAM|nr:hypothetical protein BJ138DRAFT_576519 [Hygrophoropsis aurantiaca]
MHRAYSSAQYPNYGKPCHVYVPPGYPNPFAATNHSQDQNYSASQPHNQGTREKFSTRPPTSPDSQTFSFSPPDPDAGLPNFPFFPPSSDAPLLPTPLPVPRTVRPSTTRLSTTRKLTRANSGAITPPQRVRTASDPRQQLAPMDRFRTNSDPFNLPDHLFVSFHGSNELRMRNVAFQDTVGDIKQNVVPMWPHGVVSHSAAGHSWRLGFSKSPWNAGGRESIVVQKMICELFTRLSRQGYQYLTSLNTGYQCPQLVFQYKEPNDLADFFVAHVSRSGHKLTLIRPPRRIGESIGPRLRNAWPYKIAAHRASDDEIYTVELKQTALGSLANDLDKDVFAAHALQEINSMGWTLEATVRLARSGILGLGGQKEIWVFRGTMVRSRANSRSGRF